MVGVKKKPSRRVSEKGLFVAPGTLRSDKQSYESRKRKRRILPKWQKRKGSELGTNKFAIKKDPKEWTSNRCPSATGENWNHDEVFFRGKGY